MNSRIVLVLMWALLPTAAVPCAFTPPYRLPVPFAMYAWGSSLALVMSFAIVALFARAPSLSWVSGTYRTGGKTAAPDSEWTIGNVGKLAGVGKLVSVALLILCILTGLYGTQDSFANFNMTFFWVIFVLAVPYATLLFGDFYRTLNPWESIVLWGNGLARDAFAGRLKYPKALGYYPALVLYMAFIWLELFGEIHPRGLALALLAYSLVNIAGAWLFGYRDWFRYGEFFGIFLRLLGHAAPFDRSAAANAASSRTSRWRLPFAGLVEEKTEHLSLLLFILFMLSSTAYDGLHETLAWMKAYWNGVQPHLLPLLSDDSRVAYEQSLTLYRVWQWFWLFASPFVYLAVFTLFVAAAKAITRTEYSTRELSLRFAFSLIPIAVVYHVTHYYPTLFAQGVQIVRLISDPFGSGWNLFGTANIPISQLMIDVGVIWKTQVFLIVAGHIVSSYLAHVEALRIYPNTRQATLSQVPILLLMVLFTTAGLKILSMPFAPAL